jgi:hypothetical protein
MKVTHRPTVLPRAYTYEHKTTLEAVCVLNFEQPLPLSFQYGTCETIQAIFWPSRSNKSPQNLEVVPSSLGSGPSRTTGRQRAASRILSQIKFFNNRSGNFTPKPVNLISKKENVTNNLTGLWVN